MKASLWYPSIIRLLIKHFSFQGVLQHFKSTISKGLQSQNPFLNFEVTEWHTYEDKWLAARPLSLWKDQCETKIRTAAYCIPMTANGNLKNKGRALIRLDSLTKVLVASPNWPEWFEPNYWALSCIIYSIKGLLVSSYVVRGLQVFWHYMRWAKSYCAEVIEELV